MTLGASLSLDGLSFSRRKTHVTAAPSPVVAMSARREVVEYSEVSIPDGLLRKVLAEVDELRTLILVAL